MIVARPTSLADALIQLASDGSQWTPLAGGTDLLVSWPGRPHENQRFLDLSPIAELRRVELTGGDLVLGALATYWDVISDARVSAAFPLLAAAARQVGAIQIQTRGTWAGNIANGSPAADGVPVLMAYDASVMLQSVAATREVPLDSYFTGYKKSVKRPDELIVAIRMPRRPRRREWFHKVGARSAQAITKVGVAVVQYDTIAGMDGTRLSHAGPSGEPGGAVNSGAWRIVANSVAPFVCRCRSLESVLNSAADPARRFQSPDEIRQILAADISPIDDIRSTAKYRAAVLSRLLFHFLRGEH